MQRTEVVAICGACHHPREAHQELRVEKSSPYLPSLPLRANCGIRGCSCRNYVGIMWEKRAR